MAIMFGMYRILFWSLFWATGSLCQLVDGYNVTGVENAFEMVFDGLLTIALTCNGTAYNLTENSNGLKGTHFSLGAPTRDENNVVVDPNPMQFAWVYNNYNVDPPPTSEVGEAFESFYLFSINIYNQTLALRPSAGKGATLQAATLNGEEGYVLAADQRSVVDQDAGWLTTTNLNAPQHPGCSVDGETIL
jgi:hypothetical protein